MRTKNVVDMLDSRTPIDVLLETTTVISILKKNETSVSLQEMRIEQLIVRTTFV